MNNNLLLLLVDDDDDSVMKMVVSPGVKVEVVAEVKHVSLKKYENN